MQKPKHNKRQHQMCWANMCPMCTLFLALSSPAPHIIKRIKISGHFLCCDSIFSSALFRLRQKTTGKNRASCHTLTSARKEWKKQSFHGKLNENKNHFSIPFGSYRMVQLLLCRSFWFTHRIAPFVHGTLESLISPKNILKYSYVVLRFMARKKSLKFMLWLFDVSSFLLAFFLLTCGSGLLVSLLFVPHKRRKGFKRYK